MNEPTHEEMLTAMVRMTLKTLDLEAELRDTKKSCHAAQQLRDEAMEAIHGVRTALKQATGKGVGHMSELPDALRDAMEGIQE